MGNGQDIEILKSEVIRLKSNNNVLESEVAGLKSKNNALELKVNRLESELSRRLGIMENAVKKLENDGGESCKRSFRNLDETNKGKMVDSGTHCIEISNDKESSARTQPSKKLSFDEAILCMQNETELCSYLFSHSKDSSETVVKTDKPYVTRRDMRTLRPGKCLCGFIIDTLAWQLNLDLRTNVSRMLRWYLPTTFAQKVLASESPNLDEIKRNYWGIDEFTGQQCCEEIYIPMNHNNNHWFLCIVNLVIREVTVCDSMNRDLTKDKEMQVRKVIRVLDNILKEEFGQLYNMNTFAVTHPSWVPQQKNGFDCGLYVCLMMQNGSNTKELRLNDSESERKKLACQLWRHHSNENNPLPRELQSIYYPR